MNIETGFNLSDFTTFKTGGKADFYITVEKEEHLHEALEFAKKRNLEVFILGGGSNILVSDEGFRGLVIHNKIKGIGVDDADKQNALVAAGGGELWDDFVCYTVENALYGVECLSAIPGTVGAAPVQNIGAYGQNADSAILEVHTIGIKDGIKRIFAKDECEFDYRKSIFNTTQKSNYIIYKVIFQLQRNGTVVINYPEIKNYLKNNDTPSQQAVRSAVIDIRSKKGMVVMDGHEGYKSAGSFFKNPVVDSHVYEYVRGVVDSTNGCQNWAWPLSDNSEVKLSAACLIQLSGYVRGYRKGNVGISPKHALSVINIAGATSSEIVAFVREVQETVYNKFGVLIAPEVQFVGFERPALL
ncbi:MAG: UDP-N-acetylmuramate dehydrogenase [Candidatus Magnetoovum sp. WYHC-5]|nr:UDP-N-acetylmuramate dehydrogenase [Candidatus Magnetoovum sp. WYHC-5]